MGGFSHTYVFIYEKKIFKRRLCEVVCAESKSGITMLSCPGTQHPAEQPERPAACSLMSRGWGHRLGRIECTGCQASSHSNLPGLFAQLCWSICRDAPQLPAEPEREWPAKIPARPGFTCTRRYGQRKHSAVCPNSPGRCRLAVPDGLPWLCCQRTAARFI